MENKKKTTVFQLAVESTPDIKIGFRDGLQALGTNAQRITAQNTRKLEGSVDIDACTQSLRLNLLKQKQFECFQENEKTHYCYLDNCGWFEIPVYTRKIVLSMDGKIIMECYNEILDFFRRCIVKQLENFRLAKTLDVYLSD